MTGQPRLPILFVCGPTAVGKTEIALVLAQRLKGEIISVDSMQVYRGMDIGTAKPSREDRQRVPHHLVDIQDVRAPFDVAQFLAQARAAFEDIKSRGRPIIFCGGTGLYFKVLLHGLGAAPAPNPALRANLERTPLPELLRELAERDPECLAGIDQHNPRRIIRAIEVMRLTGRPFSQQRSDWKAVRASEFEGAVLMGLSRAPGDLRRRIDARVEEMFHRGLVEETRELLHQGLAENPTAMQALGYRQVIEHLRGARSLPDTIELIKIRTRQYAKRQMTWFRRQLSLRWIHLSPKASSEDALRQIPVQG